MTNTTTAYRHDHTGIQTHAISSGVTQSHLIDAQNPTGYAQRAATKLSSGGTPTRRVFADDLLYELGVSGQHLLYDGQGTTRGVIDSSGGLAESYAFDASGEPRDGIALTSPLTDHLYKGEPRDAATGWTYLRARYLDTSTGTFNRLDPFFGNLDDPQSLHKYAYVHGDPVNAWDPSGNVSIVTVTSGTLALIAFNLGLISAGISVAFDLVRGNVDILQIVSNALVAFGSGVLAILSLPFAIVLLVAAVYSIAQQIAAGEFDGYDAAQVITYIVVGVLAWYILKRPAIAQRIAGEIAAATPHVRGGVAPRNSPILLDTVRSAARALPKSAGSRPTAFCRVLNKQTGRYYDGYSGEGYTLPQHARLRAAFEGRTTRTKWPIDNCAECVAVNKALHAAPEGTPFSMFEAVTIKVRTGEVFNRCANCIDTFGEIKFPYEGLLP